jgi:hypothetical protein
MNMALITTVNICRLLGLSFKIKQDVLNNNLIDINDYEYVILKCIKPPSNQEDSQPIDKTTKNDNVIKKTVKKDFDPDYQLRFRSMLMDYNIDNCERKFNDSWEDVIVNNVNDKEINSGIHIKKSELEISKKDENSIFKNIDKISNKCNVVTPRDLKKPHEILVQLKALLDTATASDWFGPKSFS